MRLRSILQIGVVAAASLFGLGGMAGSMQAHDLNRDFSQFHLTKWDSDNGLPSSSVSALAQTKDGYVWFGTFSGLARFDGVRFTVFDHNNGNLPHNEVLSLLATADGALWIGTPRGAARYFHGEFEAFGSSKGLPDGPIIDFIESAGQLWAAARNHGLFRLEHGNFRPVGPPGLLAGNRPHTLQPAPGGDVYAAGDIGVVRVSASGSVRNIGPEETGPVRLIFVDRPGALWAATVEGALLRLTNGVWNTNPIPGLHQAGKLGVLCMMQDRTGTLWIGSDKSGLIGIDGKRVRVYQDSPSLPEPRISGLLEDSEGGLWLGMPAFGALHMTDGGVTPYGRPEGMSWDVALSVLQTRDGTVWAGLDGGGLNLLRGGRWRAITAPQVLGGMFPYTMLESRDGSVWVATDNDTLHRFRDGVLVQKLKIPGNPGNPASLAEDSDGTLWLGAAHGLYRLRGTQWEVPSLQSGPPWSSCLVSAILFDEVGRTLVATDAGLWKLTGGRFVPVPGTEGQNVPALIRDSQGTIWAGLYGLGLLRIRGGQISRMEAADGLPETQIVSLADDGLGKLWLGGARGIYSIGLNALEQHAAGAATRLVFDEIGLGEGMRSRECNGGQTPAVWRMKDGSLWFATMRGLVKLDPSKPLRPASILNATIEQMVVEAEKAWSEIK